MAYLFCNGSYAKQAEQWLNSLINIKSVASASARWEFARAPGNTMHTYKYNLNSGTFIYTGTNNEFIVTSVGGSVNSRNYIFAHLDNTPQTGQFRGYDKITCEPTQTNKFSETAYTTPYILVTTTTFREWKAENATLLSKYTATDTFYNISKLSRAHTGFTEPSLGGIGAYGARNNNEITLQGTNPLLVTDYDDYLIVKDITVYDENKNTITGIFDFLIRSRLNNLTEYRVINQQRAEYFKVKSRYNYAFFYSPLFVSQNYSKNPSPCFATATPIIADYTLLDPDNNVLKNESNPVSYPFKSFLFMPKARSISFPTTSNSGYALIKSAEYVFENFEAIQKWFIDWGIYAYQSQNDLTNDIFPDELKPDIGIDDNTNPDPIENLPDNKSDPIDLTPVGASPNDNYDLYVLHTQSFGDFRKAFLYTDVWKAIQAFFTNPIESILSIQFFPFDFLNHDQEHLQKSTSVQLINYDIPFIDCFKVLQGYNFYNFNLGNLFVQAYYGNYLDFQAKYELYIPYCGTKVLDSSLVVNHTIYLLLSLSPITGSGTVYVYNDEMKLITTMTGAFGTTLSISSNNMPSITTNAVLNALTNSMGIIMDPLSGTINTAKGLAQDTIMADQHNFIKGQISGSSSIGGVTTPFIQVTLPVPTNPSSYDDFKGLNSQITATVGSFPSTSFVSFDEIRVNVPCTEAEKEMIYDLLKSGIYI